MVITFSNVWAILIFRSVLLRTFEIYLIPIHFRYAVRSTDSKIVLRTEYIIIQSTLVPEYSTENCSLVLDSTIIVIHARHLP